MISNEVLCGLFLAGGLSAAVFAAYLGRPWLQTFIVTVMIALGVTDAKVIMAFGVPVTLGTILYSAIFFATDMLTERYGKKAAYEAIRFSFFATVVFQLVVQTTRLAIPAQGVEELSLAMDAVFGSSFKIVVIGLAVYLISQHLDIWLYHKIHKLTGERHLWLRNNGSTLVSQFVDTYLFCFLAFYGVIEDWYMVATTGYAVKVTVGLSDTIFIYISKAFTPLDLRNSIKEEKTDNCYGSQ